jgi:hypothetical protein
MVGEVNKMEWEEKVRTGEEVRGVGVGVGSELGDLSLLEGLGERGLTRKQIARESEGDEGIGKREGRRDSTRKINSK